MEVRDLVIAFCDCINKVYSERILNRSPTRREVARIENKFRQIGFPGCMGFLESIIMDAAEYKQHGNEIYVEIMAEFRSKPAAVEIWMDMDWYCRSWKRIGSTMSGNNNSLSESPLLNSIFRGEMCMNHETGYNFTRAGIKRRLMYFIINEEYHLWPIFV